RQDVLLDGGDLGRLEQAYLKGEKTAFSELFLLGKMWAINGVSGFSTENLPPLVDLPLGSTCLLRFSNRTAWPHPMHLHGYHFKVLSHQGDPNMVGRLRDTVMVGPEEQAEVAFVADNPGDWFFHCNILSHAEAGMMAVLRVT
ncbi:MAG: multicopper oxidase family protein, partial [Gammaproteobacteria bacterium]